MFSNILVSLYVNNRVVKKVRGTDGKMYCPMSVGDKFSIVIKNTNPYRVLAVVSVDGLSVMNGKPASHDDSGYIVDANSSVCIEGYRRGNDNVAEFVVSNNNGSTYAEKRTGSSVNNGVIGVMIAPEKREPVQVASTPYPPYIRKGGPWDSGNPRSYTRSCGPCDQSMNFCEEPTSGSVGTSMGEEVYSPVKTVKFKADMSQKSVIVLHYDTLQSLRDRGLIPASGPNPFPAQNNGLYCPD